MKSRMNAFFSNIEPLNNQVSYAIWLTLHIVKVKMANESRECMVTRLNLRNQAIYSYAE